MGGISSLDASAQDRIKDTVRVVLDTFVQQYTHAFGRVLLCHARAKEEERKRFELAAAGKLDTSTDPLLEKYRLSKRPTYLSKCSLMEGKLTKQGAIHKNWKERYFVVRPDYCVDYYDTELCYRTSQKPKGTIVPAGYQVCLDVHEAQRARLEQLASKMNCVQCEYPAGPQWPDHTFEVYHERRRCYYIVASSEEEKMRWAEVFRNCVWNNKSYTFTNAVSIEAFELAVTKCRRELGHWHSWMHGGTEQEVLLDLVISDLEDTLLGDIYLSLKGSLANKLKTRQQLMAKLVAMVNEQVHLTMERMKTQEVKIRLETTELLGKAIIAVDITDREMTGQLRELADELLIPWIGEHVIPVLPDMIRAWSQQLDEAFLEARYVFDSKIAGVFDAVRADQAPMFHEHHELLGQLSFNSDEVQRIFSKLHKLEPILIGFRQHFNDVQPWWTIYTAQATVAKVLDNACFTYQDSVLKSVVEHSGSKSPLSKGCAVERLRLKEAMLLTNRDVVEKLEDDLRLASVELCKMLFLSIIKPQVLRTIYHGIKPVTDSLNNSIPDAFRLVLFGDDLFEVLLDGLLERRVDVVLDALGQRVRLEVPQS